MCDCSTQKCVPGLATQMLFCSSRSFPRIRTSWTWWRSRSRNWLGWIRTAAIFRPRDCEMRFMRWDGIHEIASKKSSLWILRFSKVFIWFQFGTSMTFREWHHTEYTARGEACWWSSTMRQGLNLHVSLLRWRGLLRTSGPATTPGRPASRCSACNL